MKSVALCLHVPEAHKVASPTFGIYCEAEAAECVGELGDTKAHKVASPTFGIPHVLLVPPVERDPEPLVDEALRADDSNNEPEFFQGDGDSDEDTGPVPTQQGGASRSRIQQYPPHLSNLNLDTFSSLGRAQGDPSSGTQGSQESRNQA
ncbi:hypothetical protein PIB30_010453 [Stylosanthes scabra]|uniref:Uncharacterized protein n=1 Tax=Stylosanthes scabra TaxID=79078 RepID=A0ABU6Y5Y6_9FABA|nr:hypothetical protein [Stylosanthes scabra]